MMSRFENRRRAWDRLVHIEVVLVVREMVTRRVSSEGSFPRLRVGLPMGATSKLMREIVFLVFATIIASLACPLNAQDQKVILVVGAEGTAEYGEQFEAWADNWQSAIESGETNAESKPGISLIRIGSGREGEQTDIQRLQAEIESTDETIRELWIVLIGHGTDDRKTTKFNLKGPDVSASQLAEWLAPLTCRIVIINCASASGTSIAKLKGNNRIVITATKSGAQHNFARFGGYLSQAIADPTLDLDKDQQTSLLEAFLAASSRTQEFYVQQTRLATELALIDDNFDGLGTPADWFEGTRVVRKSKSGKPDGLAANQVFLVRRGAEAQLSREQREVRDELESQLEVLRSTKSTMDEEAYYLALEPILLKLARVYADVESRE